ncbi:MAG: DUF952 domain-containing protein [Bacteroidia bacterium]|nr:DUF952 domain-containing protein [Bacteroidia bacterium]MDW8334246.1 DUF952 domain-containing protein [Bacteroidia bacterium]
MIYHFADPACWERALQTGFYKPPSLKSEGFIHCCFKGQMSFVARRHFPGRCELLTLHIVERRVKEIYKQERVSDSDEIFPHLYGPLPIYAVEDVSIFYPDEAL